MKRQRIKVLVTINKLITKRFVKSYRGLISDKAG
ncbi:Uncharacterised protein [Vibrio cholerae]|nr:Uncharacterised protein [Vibrio cholerae]